MHGCSYKENETDTIFKNKIQTKNEFSQRVQILLSDQKSALVFLGIGTFYFEAVGSIYCVIKKKKHVKADTRGYWMSNKTMR